MILVTTHPNVRPPGISWCQNTVRSNEPIAQKENITFVCPLTQTAICAVNLNIRDHICGITFCEVFYLQGLSEKRPLFSFGPLNALQTQLYLLPRGCFHVQEEIQQRSHQSCSLSLTYRDQERPDKLQEPAKLWCDRTQNYINGLILAHLL